MSDDKARTELARVLFEWNTGSNPYFFIGNGRMEPHDDDPYAPIADAILAAGYVKVTEDAATVERVAQALWDRAEEQRIERYGFVGRLEWTEIDDGLMEIQRERARAALRALREVSS